MMSLADRELFQLVLSRQPWPVDHVHIGEPSVLLDLFDARAADLTVTVIWGDRREILGWKRSIDLRGQKGAVAGITKVPARNVASVYQGRARIGHGEIDSLSIGTHITEPFELSICPVPELLDAWLPLLGLAGRVLVGGIKLAPVQAAIARHMQTGLLREIKRGDNCWLGFKPRWNADEPDVLLPMPESDADFGGDLATADVSQQPSARSRFLSILRR